MLPSPSPSASSPNSSDPPLDPAALPPVADIRNTIDAILVLKARGKTLDEVRQTHLEFSRRYPKLVETAMQPDLDKEQLEYLLQMFEKVQTQKVSFNAASHQVGRTMFDQYLAPNLTPDQLSAVNARVGDLERTHAQGGAGAAEIAQMAAQMAGGGASSSVPRTSNRAARRTKVRNIAKTK